MMGGGPGASGRNWKNDYFDEVRKLTVDMWYERWGDG